MKIRTCAPLLGLVLLLAGCQSRPEVSTWTPATAEDSPLTPVADPNLPVQARQGSPDAPGSSGPIGQASPVRGALVAQGTFLGAGGHATRGRIELLRTAEGYALTFDENFSTAQAPAPVVGFGDGVYVPASRVGPLKQYVGAQVYQLPAGFDPSGYSQVFIWSDELGGPLGVAELLRG
jgi:hypothetical protein